MQIVGFMEDEVQSVLELVAAVLKLGNIEFKPESRCNGYDESRVKDKNGKHLALLESIAHPKTCITFFKLLVCNKLHFPRNLM